MFLPGKLNGLGEVIENDISYKNVLSLLRKKEQIKRDDRQNYNAINVGTMLSSNEILKCMTFLFSYMYLPFFFINLLTI